MLVNYKIDSFGVIHQIEKEKFEYDSEYVNKRYNGPTKELTRYMSYLRLGYIIGTIGNFDSILDVGFGNGEFLSVCKSISENVSGYDIFDNKNLPTGVEFEKNITSKYFDVITFFDSLEHFETLDFIQNLKCKYVVISLPCCHYPENDEWFYNWKHRRPNEHLHHFNFDSLNNFMTYNGYECISQTNIEDVIRKPDSVETNILTSIFRK